MEAERRSTVSSLKGQLSNVEGSVKSMKVAVVVGSVLTVACLAAVFGVTVLANEVSKEVKVSNGTLTSKSGQAVLTTDKVFSTKITLGSETLLTESASFKVNAVVVNGETTTVICDDLVAVEENGKTSMTFAEGSVLASVVGEEAVEKRSTLANCLPNCPEGPAPLITQEKAVGFLGSEYCAYMSGRAKVKGWKAKLAKMVLTKLCARAAKASAK